MEGSVESSSVPRQIQRYSTVVILWGLLFMPQCNYATPLLPNLWWLRGAQAGGLKTHSSLKKQEVPAGPTAGKQARPDSSIRVG